MTSLNPMLAVIPAREGSKGLPGKNIRPFIGLPLIAHSILLANMCSEIDDVIVSTDSKEIVRIANSFGANTPFIRPKNLAQDDTPMWPVLQHALREMEKLSGYRYGSLLLLDPTNPIRLPKDITGAYQQLNMVAEADGIVGVSKPEFNPLWYSVIEKNGWMTDLVDGASNYTRRQDVPSVYLINGSLYIWRRDFLTKQDKNWRAGKLLVYPTKESRAIHIDTIKEFEQAELLIKTNQLHLPWLNQ